MFLKIVQIQNAMAHYCNGTMAFCKSCTTSAVKYNPLRAAQNNCRRERLVFSNRLFCSSTRVALLPKLTCG